MFSFIKTRPPLVVFFLCVFTLTVTILYFAFYIKNTEVIPDSDRRHDWFQLLRHFNDLETCIELNRQIIDKKPDTDSFVETTKIYTLVSINNTEFIRSVARIRGFLNLDGWYSNCPKNNPKPSSFQIYFEVPKPLNDSITKFDVCVTIEGPAEYLPIFSEPNCNAEYNDNNLQSLAFLSSKRRLQSGEFCKEGALVKLDFHPQVKDNLADYLSDNQKQLIYFHLMCTIYVLLSILMIIVVYGILQSDYLMQKWVTTQKR
ncbi:hypothetical protein NQ317_013514 [Molorchus minor]|uniref:TMEM248/TMEM219 domain-containing protein n=1 Tax=Molorchus minor TaxID=1323400 RepID=A0ABQ9JWF4_9CUCU|nr:hypothetical protein NQ317_013514 [Molorchus minor]